MIALKRKSEAQITDTDVHGRTDGGGGGVVWVCVVCTCDQVSLQAVIKMTRLTDVRSADSVGMWH